MVVLTRRAARLEVQCASATTDVVADTSGSVAQKSTTTLSMPRRTKASRKRVSPPPPSSPRSGSARPSGGGGGGVARATRRPIRPVDRQKMRDWLEAKLNSGEMPNNLWWREKGRLFAVKWSHAARHGFSAKEDAKLFKAWAEHSGLHQEGEIEDHRKWKSNFRCAIHSLLDVKEITTKDGRKGQNAARIYEILDKPREKRKSSKSTTTNLKSEDESKGEDSDSGVSTAMDCTDTLPLPVSHLLETASVEQSNMPNFLQLGVSTSVGLTCVQQNHLSGGCITIKEDPNPSPISPFAPGTSTSHFSSTQPAHGICPSSSSPSHTFPIPIPTTTIAPMDLIDMEDMRPVGFMTKITSLRYRSHSGDSGFPQSSSFEEEEVEEGGPPKLPSVVLSEEISGDEGIFEMVDAGAGVFNIKEFEALSCHHEVISSAVGSDGDDILDISRSAPEPVVTLKNGWGEDLDYKYTSQEDYIMEIIETE